MLDDDTKKININGNKRMVELDIAKGFAVIFMVLVHVCEMFYIRAEDGGSISTRIIEFLGSPPAAPVFMLSLGAGIVFSRHNSPKQLAKRGLKLLVISYIYNIAVYALPYLIVYWFRDHDPEVLEFGLTQILSVDILQFAGLALIFMALALKMRIKDWQLVCLAFAFPMIGKLLENTVEIQRLIPSQIVGLLWRTNEMSYFPFCSWILYPIVGYVMAHSLWPKYENKKVFYSVSALIGLVTYVVMSVIAYYAGIEFGAFGELYQGAYYGMGVYGNICILSFVVFWLAFCFFLKKVLPQILQGFLIFLSKHIMKIYILQYFFIYYIQVVIVGEENSFSLGIVFLLAALIMAISCGIIWLTEKLHK